jgi:tRNA pseudouridine38-40 synthase
VLLNGAGRTDKGVHARQQVASCSLHASIELSRLSHSLNCLLPPTIRICNAVHVTDDFHARFNATERTYRYFVSETPSALCNRFTGCANALLDVGVMQQMAAMVVGEHDFTAFSREERDSPAKRCKVTSCRWHRLHGMVVLQISANRFLRSMVRYLVHAMLQGGKGCLAPPLFQEMVEGGTSSYRMVAAPASGLFLWRIRY